MDKIGRVSRAELAMMCSEGVQSVLRQTSNVIVLRKRYILG